MAIWQQRGVTSPVEAWDPDFSFLTQVYTVNQMRFDKGFNQVKSVYNSLLNGPLTNDTNKAYRGEIFKRLDETLKKTSSLDFSKSENVSKAISLLDPLTKDKDFAYDLAVTKYHQSEKAKMDSYKNNPDPEKRKLYSDYAAAAINYAEEDLRNAKRGDGSITSVTPQNFVMFDDWNEYLDVAAEKEKLSIKQYDLKGGYILEQENGQPAIMPFAAWAKQKLGTRFDEQFNLMGKVQAETQIRTKMKSQGISREDAVMQVSTALTPGYTKENETSVSSLTSNLEMIQEHIDILEKEYPDGVPANSPHLKKEYDELVQQKEIHKQLINSGSDNLKRINSESSKFIANNLYSVFTGDSKTQGVLGWSSVRAMATEKRNIKADEVYIHKMDNSIKMKIHNDNLKIQGAELDLKKQELKYKIWKESNDQLNDQNKDASGKNGTSGGKKATDATSILGEGQQMDYLGTVVGSGNDAVRQKVDVLQQRLNENNNTLFDAIVDPSNGLLQFSLPSNTNFNEMSAALHKLKTIAGGNVNTKLNDREQSIIKDLGVKLGYNLKPDMAVGNPDNANVIIQAIGTGTYKKGQEKVSLYKKTGTLPGNVKNINAFNKALNSLQGIEEGKKSLEISLSNIHQMISNDKEGIYEGAKVIGHTQGTGIPIYDLNKISIEAKNSLNPLISKEFDKFTAPVGQKYSYSGLTAGELNAFFNENITTLYNEDGKPVKQKEELGRLMSLPPEQLAKLFGNRMEVDYNPVTSKVKVNLKINPDDGIAKALKLKEGNYNFEIPYASVRANSNVLPRFNQGVNNITSNAKSAGMFKDFTSNPYSRISSNSVYDAAGFSFDIAGVDYTDAQGNKRYGLNVYTEVDDPVKGGKTSSNTILPISDPNNPMSFVELENLPNQEFLRYLETIGAYTKSIKDGPKIPLK